jgi:hypothetical protein
MPLQRQRTLPRSPPIGRRHIGQACGAPQACSAKSSLELNFAVGGRRPPSRRWPGLIGRTHDPRPLPDRRQDSRLGRNLLRRRFRDGRLRQAGFQDRGRVCGVCIRDATGLQVAAGDKAGG